MNTKEIDKKYKAYSKYYKNLLVNEGIKDVDERMSSYEKRLKEMYNSKEFKAHNVYPSTNVSFVYAVIAMCLELKEAGYTDERIVPVVEKVWRAGGMLLLRFSNSLTFFHSVFLLYASGTNPITQTG